MLLCLETDLPLHNALISFSKYLSWHNLITDTSAVCTERKSKYQVLLFDIFCLSWWCRISFYLSIISTKCLIFFQEGTLSSASITVLLPSTTIALTLTAFNFRICIIDTFIMLFHFPTVFWCTQKFRTCEPSRLFTLGTCCW